ncbi:UNVERIFIED_CONTAM: hypothetical protein H355_012918, partial [Colinus virginianus]
MLVMLGWVAGERVSEAKKKATVLILLSSPRPKPFWRPWLPQEEYTTKQQKEQMDSAQPLDAAGDHSPEKALALFHHPVRYVRSVAVPQGWDRQALTAALPTRLLWPKSRCFDYLYSVGEKLLQNFPVQATLCLYDDSDSDGDEAEDDDDDDDDGRTAPRLGQAPRGRPEGSELAQGWRMSGGGGPSSTGTRRSASRARQPPDS